MTKFQRFEKYPDEFIRMFLESRSQCFRSQEIFNDYNKNFLAAIKDLKKGMRQALEKLFKAKDQIYQILMKIDLLKAVLPNVGAGKTGIKEFMTGIMTWDERITFKDTFGVGEEHIQVEQKFKIQNPRIFKKVRQKKGIYKTLPSKNEISQIYPMRRQFLK